jgi:hypothetical protein
MEKQYKKTCLVRETQAGAAAMNGLMDVMEVEEGEIVEDKMKDLVIKYRGKNYDATIAYHARSDKREITFTGDKTEVELAVEALKKIYGCLSNKVEWLEPE